MTKRIGYCNEDNSEWYNIFHSNLSYKNCQISNKKYELDKLESNSNNIQENCQKVTHITDEQKLNIFTKRVNTKL